MNTNTLKRSFRAVAVFAAAALIILILPCLGIHSSAVGANVIYDSDTGFGYTIDVSQDGKFTATICEFNPADKYLESYDIKIPDTISSAKYPVTAIASNTFSSFVSRANIKGVSIPNNVRSIGDSAFSNCTALEKVNMSNSVQSLGSFAFAGCISLKDMKLPDTLTEVGYSAFSGCTSLATLNISKAATYIGQSAFSGCTALTKVEIPDSVKNIGSSAFEGCTALNNLKLSKNLQSIDSYVFSNCSSLISVEIPSSVQTIGNNAFAGCTHLTSINIPDSVQYIGNSAFSGCTNLSAVILPFSLENISDGAFYGTNVTIWGYANSYAETYARRNGLYFQSNGAVYRVTFSADNLYATVNNIAIRSSRNVLVVPPSSVTKGEQLTIDVTAPQNYDISYITVNNTPFSNGSTYIVGDSDVNIFVSYKLREAETTTAAQTTVATTTTAAQVTTQPPPDDATDPDDEDVTTSSADTTAPVEDSTDSSSYIKVDSDLEDINGEKVRIITQRDNFIGPATVRITNTAEAYEAAASASDSLDVDNAIYYAFDISLLDQNGKENQGIMAKGSITFQLPVPTELLPYADNIKVYHIVDETPEFIKSNLIEDVAGVKRIQFESDSFSPYMLIAETEEEIIPVIEEEDSGDTTRAPDNTPSAGIIIDDNSNNTPDAQVVDNTPSKTNTTPSYTNYNGSINPHTGAIIAGGAVAGITLICIPLVRSRKKRKRAKSSVE